MTQHNRTFSEKVLPFVEQRDFALAVTETAHILFANVMSTKANTRLLENLGLLSTKLRPAKRHRLEQLYEAILGSAIAHMPSKEVYVPDAIGTLLIQRMFYARLAKNKAWRPAIKVAGGEHVEAALATGTGVVFWLVSQELTALIFRMVCWDRGWSLHHLSNEMHGPSDSRVGSATFNRRDCRIEDQLSDRIPLNAKTTTQALTSASKVLRSGSCVGVRGIGWSSKPSYYPFFAGHTSLALGAPVLARRTGSKLFTVSARARAGAFELLIEEMTLPPERKMQDVGSDFVSRMEHAVLAAPTLWFAWSDQWKPGVPPAPH